MDLMNNSMISEFVLLGLTNTWELEIFFFFIFLLAYAAIVAGNLLIVVAVTFDSHLYSTPMYFLLGNLSFLDMCISTITTPKMVTDFLREIKTISLWGCMAQMFFLHFLGGSEMTLLIVMAVDRYIAICKPLHYTSIMNRRVLMGSVLLSWAVGFVHTMSQMVFTITLPFCGPNIVDNIFCDLPLVLKLLACIDTYILEMWINADSGVLATICFILLLISYSSILFIICGHSKDGISKALSTCTAHITVVVLFFGPCIFIYLWPLSITWVDKFLAVFYAVITPLLNPAIYTLRNQEIKNAIKRL
uniref:Olfactory receptor n=1 Tax=Suricata suricatta TaxID=37032 RepID=A0A673TGP5_SURSU